MLRVNRTGTAGQVSNSFSFPQSLTAMLSYLDFFYLRELVHLQKQKCITGTTVTKTHSSAQKRLPSNWMLDKTLVRGKISWAALSTCLRTCMCVAGWESQTNSWLLRIWPVNSEMHVQKPHWTPRKTLDVSKLIFFPTRISLNNCQKLFHDHVLSGKPDRQPACCRWLKWSMGSCLHACPSPGCVHHVSFLFMKSSKTVSMTFTSLI